MSETGVRELFVDATSDGVLGTSTVDVDAVIVRERRAAARRRLIAAGGAVAAVIGLAVGIPAVVAGRDPSVVPSTGASPVDTPSPLATRPEREDFAFSTLLEHFPGATRRASEYSNWDGRVMVEAELPGPPAVLLFVEALRVDADPEHPCGRPATAGCVEYPQPDGSVVMVVHDAEEGRVGVIAIHLRTNGTHVQLGVTWESGAVAPSYSDEAMVRAAVDPRFTAMTPGTGG